MDEMKLAAEDTVLFIEGVSDAVDNVRDQCGAFNSPPASLESRAAKSDSIKMFPRQLIVRMILFKLGKLL